MENGIDNYSEVVKELEKSYIFLLSTIREHSALIQNIKSVKKGMEKNDLKSNPQVEDLSLKIELFNEGLKNVVNFIRSSEMGDLEDLALFLEKATLPTWEEVMISTTFGEWRDLNKFQKALSEESVKITLENLSNLAYSDQNPKFLKSYQKSSLISA